MAAWGCTKGNEGSIREHVSRRKERHFDSSGRGEKILTGKEGRMGTFAAHFSWNKWTLNDFHVTPHIPNCEKRLTFWKLLAYHVPILCGLAFIKTSADFLVSSYPDLRCRKSKPIKAWIWTTGIGGYQKKTWKDWPKFLRFTSFLMIWKGLGDSWAWNLFTASNMLSKLCNGTNLGKTH